MKFLPTFFQPCVIHIAASSERITLHSLEFRRRSWHRV